MAKPREFHPGDIVERLELIENLGLRPYCGKNSTWWRCRCTACGKIIEVPVRNLGTAVKDCGCWRSTLKKPIQPGTRFGRLVVLRFVGIRKGHGAIYECKCDCGNIKQIRRRALVIGQTQSCGCLHDELFSQKVKAMYPTNYIGGTSRGRVTHMDSVFKSNTSGYRNVSWHKATQRWRVRIQYRGITHSLGGYTDIEEAARVAEQARAAIKADWDAWYAEYKQKQKDREMRNLQTLKMFS